MTFSYAKGTISGTLPGVCAPADMIQIISTTLQNDLGWTLTEDRSDQAGVNHKVILQSNGESGDAPTFYMILSSGTDNVDIQAATFWDTGTHTVGSGVASPTSTTVVRLHANEDITTKYWISGDLEGVTFVTFGNGAYDGAHLGRIRQFTTTSGDPFPICIVGSTAVSVDVLGGGNVYSFLDGTTDLSTGESDWDSFYTTPLTSAGAPTKIPGQVLEECVCFPLMASVSDASPTRRATRGFSQNIWTTVGPAGNAISFNPQDIFTAPDGRTYQVFYDSSSSSRCIVIRRS